MISAKPSEEGRFGISHLNRLEAAKKYVNGTESFF